MHTSVKIVIEDLHYRDIPFGLMYLPPDVMFPYGCLGVPTGGEWLLGKMNVKRMRSGLHPLRFPTPDVPTVIVDDVWTTGRSVRAFYNEHKIRPDAIWVMFLRGMPPSDIPFGYLVDARNLPLWEAKECPLCAVTKVARGTGDTML